MPICSSDFDHSNDLRPLKSGFECNDFFSTSQSGFDTESLPLNCNKYLVI